MPVYMAATSGHVAKRWFSPSALCNLLMRCLSVIPVILALLFVFVLPANCQVDISGTWVAQYHEDQPERIPGPELGDYLGLPINAAARMRADSYDADLLTLPEYQCRPHPSDYGDRH